MTDVIAAFEAGCFAPEDFDHAEHVRVAWHYLERFGEDDGSRRFRSRLRSLAVAAGFAQKYHETITRFFLLVIAERRRESQSFDEFAAANPDLLTSAGELLRRYYRSSTMSSERARRQFLLPDRLADNDEARTG